MCALRTLHVGKYFPPYSGGMENFLKDLLGALVREGVSTSALVHQHIPGQPFRQERENGTTILRIPTWGHILYTPLSPAFPLHLTKALRFLRPHILHFHFPNPSAFWCLFMPAARRIPWVIHWHSDVVPSEIDPRLKVAYRAYSPFERAVMGNAKRLIATSQTYLEASDPLRPWRAKCAVIPLGVDPNRLPPPGPESLKRAENSWIPGAFRVLAVGRLTYYKGFGVLVEAISGVPDAAVQIVGAGALHDELSRQINERRLGGRVSLLGALRDEALQALLATCHCLCLPSIERTEAFGLILPEAMRYGRAVIASDIPGSGVGWVIRQGQNGLLVPPNQGKLLAEAIMQLKSQPSLCSQLGKRGRRRFRELFHIRAVARKVKALYTHVLETRAG